MEEILSTISRIIAEDPPPAGSAAAAHEEVLDLTEAVADDGSVRHLSPSNPTPTAAPGAPAAAPQGAAVAFAQLAAAVQDRRREGDLPLGGSGRTIEDVVREMLRPMVQSWLDQHLAGLVERLVREEIARVKGEAGL